MFLFLVLLQVFDHHVTLYPEWGEFERKSGTIYHEDAEHYYIITCKKNDRPEKSQFVKLYSSGPIYQIMLGCEVYKEEKQMCILRAQKIPQIKVHIPEIGTLDKTGKGKIEGWDDRSITKLVYVFPSTVKYYDHYGQELIYGSGGTEYSFLGAGLIQDGKLVGIYYKYDMKGVTFFTEKHIRGILSDNP